MAKRLRLSLLTPTRTTSKEKTELKVNADSADDTLSRYRGSPVVLAFFPADWDPGRVHQMELYEAALGRQAEFLQISVESSALEAELPGEGSATIPLVQGLDRNGSLGREFAIQGENAIVVLDSEGDIAWRWDGEALPPADRVIEAVSSIGARSVTRRQLIFTSVAVIAALYLAPTAGAVELRSREAKIDVRGGYELIVNGRSHSVPGDPRITLLDALRERIGLTGTKKGCDHGQCGACTVLMNGRRVNSCLVLAAQAVGARIETVEGLSSGDRLHPVQEAFITHDGFQCGYCTSGQIMSAVACIQEGHTKSPDEIREWMSGNICRCGAYQGILQAVQEASSKMGKTD